VIFMTNEEIKHLVDSMRHNRGEDDQPPIVPEKGAQAATIGATTRSPFFASFIASVQQNAREARDVTCGADSASSTRHEIKEASFDHACYSQSSAGASQHLLQDEMSQVETTVRVRTAEPSRSCMWSEAVPGDETAGESEGEAFFDDVITCQIADLADDDLDEAGEFDNMPDVPVIEPLLLKQVTSRAFDVSVARENSPAAAERNDAQNLFTTRADFRASISTLSMTPTLEAEAEEDSDGIDEYEEYSYFGASGVTSHLSVVHCVDERLALVAGTTGKIVQIGNSGGTWALPAAGPDVSKTGDLEGGRHVLADTEHIRGGSLGLPVGVLGVLGGGDGGICHAGGLGDCSALEQIDCKAEDKQSHTGAGRSPQGKEKEERAASGSLISQWQPLPVVLRQWQPDKPVAAPSGSLIRQWQPLVTGVVPQDVSMEVSNAPRQIVFPPSPFAIRSFYQQACLS
jgi:hypothetical protein